MMTCPLKQLDGYTWPECQGYLCAWYDGINKCCMMRTLVSEIQTMNRINIKKNTKIFGAVLSHEE